MAWQQFTTVYLCCQKTKENRVEEESCNEDLLDRIDGAIVGKGKPLLAVKLNKG